MKSFQNYKSANNNFKVCEKFACCNYSNFGDRNNFFNSFFLTLIPKTSTPAPPKEFSFEVNGKITRYRALIYIHNINDVDVHNVDVELIDFKQNIGDPKKLGVSLLSKEGLAQFFPKYSGIEYYFAGMFVNNLLWNKKTISD